FFLFSTVPVALNLTRLLPKQENDSKALKSLLSVGTIAACTLPVIYLQIGRRLGLPEMLSEQDVRYVETNFPRARLLNHWNYGGIFIFYDRGRIPVFIDGRAATAYPDAVLRDYFKLGQAHVDENAWDEILEKYKIDTVLW